MGVVLLLGALPGLSVLCLAIASTGGMPGVIMAIMIVAVIASLFRAAREWDAGNPKVS